MKKLLLLLVLVSGMMQAQTNKRKLDEKEKFIMVHGGTERPFSSPLNKEKRRGVYLSPATGDTLFLSTAKFNSGTGWPSFDSATDKVDLGDYEQGGREVIEKSTGYHLGHVFYGERSTPKNTRYCINGDALEFIPTKQEHDVITYQRIQDSVRISRGIMISPYYYSLQDGEIVYKSRVEMDSVNKANHYIPELDDN